MQSMPVGHVIANVLDERLSCAERYVVTGDKDLVLVICMHDMEEFEAFQTEFCTDNPMISRFTTSVVVDPAKVGLAVPETT